MGPVIKEMSHVDRWKNRRRMAWISLIAGLAFPMLLLGTDSRELGDIAYPFYIFVGSVVGAYIGFATVDDKWTQNARHVRKPQVGAYRGRNRYSRDSRVGDEWMEAERADRPHGF